jgi:hypothetical protein
VLCLGWNTKQSNLVASGGADKTVRLFDLQSPEAPTRTLSKTHKDKVQALQWNPAEASVLVSGSFDKTCAVSDFRTSSSKPSLKLQVDGEVESLVWDCFNPAVRVLVLFCSLFGFEMVILGRNCCTSPLTINSLHVACLRKAVLTLQTVGMIFCVLSSPVFILTEIRTSCFRLDISRYDQGRERHNAPQ